MFRGLANGFCIGFAYPSSLRSVHHNHPSSWENPSIITNHLQAKLRLGRLTGSLLSSLVQPVHVSPMGHVPKSHSDKRHLVVDLSAPQRRSVHDGILSDLCSLHYASINNALDIITNLGKSTALVKLDLSNAYCIILMHPDDQLLLGITYQHNTYVDRSLPFGLRSAP